MSSIETQPNQRVSAAISDERVAARDELLGAWQSQVERVERELRAIWDERIGELLEKRFADLGERLQREFSVELEERVSASAPAIRDRARQQIAEEFNRAARRLLAHETEGEWASALVDAASGFASCAILLKSGGPMLRLLAARAAAGVPASLNIPLEGAAALASAVESRTAVVTLATEGEVSAPLATVLGSMSAKCAILPVLAEDRVPAVLVAGGEQVDVNGLEAIASLAGTALELRARKPAAEAKTPAGEPLPQAEESARLRAQRFARVRAAEIRLYKAQAVAEGRTRKKLYKELKEEIDSARSAYAREFLHASSSMPDYLHSELVRILANEEVSALGEEYPGPLA